MSKNKKFYCQPLTLNRLNLWLWITSVLLLGIILELETTDSLNWLSVVLVLVFVVLAAHLYLSSFITVNADQLELHFPFSRQALILTRHQIDQLVRTNHTLDIQLIHHKFSYRYLMSAKKQAALLKRWKEQL